MERRAEHRRQPVLIITGPNGANLNGNAVYPIFGSVVRGLDVAKEINALVPTTARRTRRRADAGCTSR